MPFMTLGRRRRVMVVEWSRAQLGLQVGEVGVQVFGSYWLVKMGESDMAFKCPCMAGSPLLTKHKRKG
jgi:hypothetical protein